MSELEPCATINDVVNHPVAQGLYRDLQERNALYAGIDMETVLADISSFRQAVSALTEQDSERMNGAAMQAAIRHVEGLVADEEIRSMTAIVDSFEKPEFRQFTDANPDYEEGLMDTLGTKALLLSFAGLPEKAAAMEALKARVERSLIMKKTVEVCLAPDYSRNTLAEFLATEVGFAGVDPASIKAQATQVPADLAEIVDEAESPEQIIDFLEHKNYDDPKAMVQAIIARQAVMEDDSLGMRDSYQAALLRHFEFFNEDISDFDGYLSQDDEDARFIANCWSYVYQARAMAMHIQQVFRRDYSTADFDAEAVLELINPADSDGDDDGRLYRPLNPAALTAVLQAMADAHLIHVQDFPVVSYDAQTGRVSRDYPNRSRFIKATPRNAGPAVT